MVWRPCREPNRRTVSYHINYRHTLDQVTSFILLVTPWLLRGCTISTGEENFKVRLQTIDQTIDSHNSVASHPLTTLTTIWTLPISVVLGSRQCIIAKISIYISYRNEGRSSDDKLTLLRRMTESDHSRRKIPT